jgi:tetratricopeptide (TPR) repeat protein
MLQILRKPFTISIPKVVFRLSGYFLCLWVLLSFTNQLWAVNPTNPEVKSKILEGVELTIMNEFKQAERLYGEFIIQYPDEPFGYFYIAAVIQAEMLDAEDYDRILEFEKNIDLCVLKSENIKKERPDDPWPLFYEGSAYLYKSYMQGKEKKWWPAYRSAKKGAGRLESILDLDSRFYDAFLGIGSYKYWKSSKTKFLQWLPFIKDEREIGIQMIKVAIESGQFVQLIARDQLAWIMLDSGKYEEAKKYAGVNMRLYPGSRFFQWTMLEVFYRAGDKKQAFEMSHRMVENLRMLPQNNHYNEINCLLRMAEIQYDSENYDEARTCSHEILPLVLDEQVSDRAKKKLKRALEIRQECDKIIASFSTN